MARIAPFEKHTSRYEAWFDRHPWAYRSELRAVQHLLPGEHPQVEIGVGTGRFARPLGIPWGVEPSPRMAAVARTRGIHVVQAVAEHLPFAPGTIAVALMVTTICFLDDPLRALAEAARVLRPGGWLVIGFVDRASFLGRMYEQHKDKNAFYREATFYSVTDVQHMLRRTGFQDLVWVQTLFRPLPEVSTLEPVREGTGEGAFVVVRARLRKAVG